MKETLEKLFEQISLREDESKRRLCFNKRKGTWIIRNYIFFL